MSISSDEIFPDKLEFDCELLSENIMPNVISFPMQEPVSIFLGERHKWKGAGAKRRLVTKEDFVYYVPILKTLEVLLNNRQFTDEVCYIKIFTVLHVPPSIIVV